MAPSRPPERGGVDLTGPYEVVPNWLEPTDEGWTTFLTGVTAESADRIFILLVTGPPGSAGTTEFDAAVPGSKRDDLLFTVDRNGRVIDQWSQW